MPKKRIDSASKTAEKLAAIALRHLSKYSEEQQEERISRAEKLVATARVGTSRTLHRLLVLGRPGFLPELDEHLLEESPVSLT